MSQRTAIILFNLGGPDSLEAVEPFLCNLFSDPAIIRAPKPVRYLLAKFISSRRAKVAQHIYAQLGNKSPILPNTEAQAKALEKALGDDHRCFICMRYWHPMAEEVVKKLKRYKPDRVVLLPLYPQYSTTTTASSFAAFKALWPFKVEEICCYPVEEGFIKAQVEIILPLLKEAAKSGKPRLLLSAHGLPEKVIAGGDPYQKQCESTAQQIVRLLKQQDGVPEFDWLNSYQSRVGPLKWIGPSTEDEIIQAGADHVPLVIAPIAFVSEHSETLVELDIEYRQLAEEKNVPYYGRAATVGTHPAFIAALAEMVRAALAKKQRPRVCPQDQKECGCHGSV